MLIMTYCSCNKYPCRKLWDVQKRIFYTPGAIPIVKLVEACYSVEIY